MKVKVSRQELARIIEVSERVAKRTNSKVVVMLDRIILTDAAPTPVGAA